MMRLFLILQQAIQEPLLADTPQENKRGDPQDKVSHYECNESPKRNNNYTEEESNDIGRSQPP